MSRETLWAALHVTNWGEFWWVMVGLTGQVMFTMRFLVQWVVSERSRKSVIPVAFWYFSLGGGMILLSYAIWRKDPVFILGQSTGMVIYLRNLWLIHAERRARAHADD
ncbi:MAG: lipid-A-disaccharide synthase N-terminal domain-containing protein [Celeribacter marinus]|uniref:lipid-A-disaccharide synthase N-terminal domain-containing protein n=1 Tax=Celeribacter marinus TaxID=1397108 RepID=UPI0031749E82